MLNDLLFEIGTEELPSGAVLPLSLALMNNLKAALDKANIGYGCARSYATPRRLAVLIESVEAIGADLPISRRGPSVAQAHDKDGKPTPALLGFAKSCGVTIDELTTLTTEKGAWWVYDAVQTGAKTVDLIPELIKESIAALPIAKAMRWGASDLSFVRPVHWIVLLYGQQIIEADILGLKAGRVSFGHRFHHPQSIEILSPAQYEEQLKNAFVIADFDLRRQMIEQQVRDIALSRDKTAVMPEALVEEVTSIVEWPCALLAQFDPEFLEVPKEALIASMQSHQKCFALCDARGNLAPYFITVSNIASLDPQRVIAGNEKVMRARLSDAAFFFRQDKKQALSASVEATQKVIFQANLGTLYDKASRIGLLMDYFSNTFPLNKTHALRAALLSKCDLMTGMVGEFPELQGLMGYYYACHDHEDESVAVALNEQYMPRFSKDDLPKTDLGKALSLADRLDVLVGAFAMGQKPTGVKDPFKLRRHALAVARILIATPQPLKLSCLIKQALLGFDKEFNHALVDEIKPFILDRLTSYYQSQGIAGEIVQAILLKQQDELNDVDRRINALQAFVSLPQAYALSQASKRVNHLLHQAGLVDGTGKICAELLKEEAEIHLYNEIQSLATCIEPYYKTQEYGLILNHLASLQKPVDSFFEHVMVMVDDPLIKENRLFLLSQLQLLLQGVADISVLSVA